MGYNTTILILNDGFDQLQKYPQEFVDGINRAMHDGGTVGVGNHANVVEVMKAEHADVFRLYASEANTIIELSPWSKKTLRIAEQFPAVVKDFIDAARGRLNELEAALP